MNATETTTIPRLRLWQPAGLPLHWVVENEETRELFAVRAMSDGWENRIPFKGYRESLRETPGYCYLGSGVPLRRPWKEVCMDSWGRN